MAISVLTISLAFSMPFFISFPLILLTVGSGFILHEIGHKIVAVRLGCIAVYRAWMEGLVLAVIFALMTGGRFVFAAPGAVYIYKQYLTRKENGLISLAGPLVNILLGLFFLNLAFTPSLAVIGLWGFRVNIFLAFFNMLPVPPLDGSKVVSWNAGVWALFFGLSAVLFFFPELLVKELLIL